MQYDEPLEATAPDETAVPATPRRGSRTPAIIAGVVAAVALGVLGQQVGASAWHAQVWPVWAAADARFDEASAEYEATAERGDSVQRLEGVILQCAQPTRVTLVDQR